MRAPRKLSSSDRLTLEEWALAASGLPPAGFVLTGSKSEGCLVVQGVVAESQLPVAWQLRRRSWRDRQTCRAFQNAHCSSAGESTRRQCTMFFRQQQCCGSKISCKDVISVCEGLLQGTHCRAGRRHWGPRASWRQRQPQTSCRPGSATWGSLGRSACLHQEGRQINVLSHEGTADGPHCSPCTATVRHDTPRPAGAECSLLLTQQHPGHCRPAHVLCCSAQQLAPSPQLRSGAGTVTQAG